MFKRRTFVLFFICSFVSLAGILVLPVAFADTNQSPADIEHVSDGSLDEPGDEAIDIDSDDDSGVTSVVVRFEPHGSDIGPQAADNSGSDVEDLKRHANESKEQFRERFGDSDEAGAAANNESAVTIKREFWIANAALIEVDTDRVPLEELLETPGVERIHANFEVDVHSTASSGSPSGSTGFSTTASASAASSDFTYGLEMIGIPAVWTEFGGTDPGTGTSVAVLDTGVDDSHEDLTVTKWSEFDSFGNPVDSDPNDVDGHGTHVAGTVGGTQDPAGGGPTYGVAPGTDLYGVKVLDDDGSGSFAQIIAGMEWTTTETDADIMQMSLGTTGTVDDFIEPVRNANDAGIVVIASAGNSEEGSSSSPANVFESISVGAVDEDQDVADFSSGETIDTDDAWEEPPDEWPDEYIVPDLAAPGVDVESAEAGTDTETLSISGTSMAAPHVAGSSALLLENNPHLEPEDIHTAFEATAFANSGDQDTRYGHGIINTHDAIKVSKQDGYVTTLGITTNNTVSPGDTLVIESKHTNKNIFDQTATRDIELSINGTSVSQEELTLEPTENGNVTIEYTVEEADVGAEDIILSTQDQNTTLQTEIPPEFEPTILDEQLDDPFVVDTAHTIPVEVENVDDYAGGGSLDLYINETREVAGDLNIPETEPGDTAVVEFNYTPSTDDKPALNITAKTAHGASERIVDVVPPGESRLTISDTNSPIESDDVEANITIENIGGTAISQNLTVDVLNETADVVVGSNTTDFEVDAFSNTTETVTIPTQEGDNGTYTLTATTPDNSTDTPISIQQVGTFEVAITDISDPINVSENISVDAEITNVGDETATQDIVVSDNSSSSTFNTTTVELDAGESKTITAERGSTLDDVGPVAVTVSSDDDSATETLTVDPPEPPEITSLTIDEDRTNDVATVSLNFKPGGVNISAARLGLQADFTSFTETQVNETDVADGGTWNTTFDVDDLPSDGTYTAFAALPMRQTRL